MRGRYFTAFCLILIAASSLGGLQTLHLVWRAGYTGLGQIMPFTDLPRYHLGLLFGYVRSHLISSNEAGLPPVRLYVAEQSMRRLTEDLPENIKKWQPGFLTYSDGDIKPVEVRYRGDNPVNWVGRKKSWRLKTRKKNLINGTRRFNYWHHRNMIFFVIFLAIGWQTLSGFKPPRHVWLSCS